MLPLLLLRIEVKQLANLQLPEYAGSMLRGAFGHALKELACTTKMPSCVSCPLAQICVYTQVFEAPVHQQGQPQQQFVNPYVVKAPHMANRLITQNTTWHFDMVLIGKAIEQLPIVAYAWQKACHDGFGKSQSQAQLLGVYQNNTLLYQAGRPLAIYTPTTITPCPPTAEAHLQFISPLRIQHQNHIILQPKQLTAPILLTALFNRVQRLAQLNGVLFDLDFKQLFSAANDIHFEAKLKRDTLTRYSNRQHRLMHLDGLVGDITLSGDLSLFLELLSVGEYIHVGKNATLGLGEYNLKAS